MSEKIYARLLKLFPSRFRDAYGEDALQLFRDRARNEGGLFPTLRLWFDLLADLVISVPREYFYAEPELLAAHPRSGGVPSFYVLGEESPRPGALVFGTLLSVLALATFSALLSRGVAYRRTATPARQRYFSAYRDSHASQPGSAPTSAARSKTLLSAGAGANLRSADGRFLPGYDHPALVDPTTPHNANSSAANPSVVPAPPGPNSPSQPAQNYSDAGSPPPESNSPAKPSTGGTSLLAAQRHRVVASAAANLKQYYVNPTIGAQMSEALLAHEHRGDDDSATGDALAVLLTKQMRDVSHDLHLDMFYTRETLPDQPGHDQPGPDKPGAPTPESQARYRQTIAQQNCTFEKVEVLPYNIGYLKLDSFPDLSVCRSAASAAMNRLNGASAVIFDLRDNRGGSPEMVMFLASYLFDHPEFMYNPRENTSDRSWTQSPVPRNKLADKPVFILTSHSTASAAEHFSYDLKMLKRATLVGETTGGVVHSGVLHRLDDHFGIVIPETQPINPFGKADWAVIGVQPDVKVPASNALATAERLAAAPQKR